MARLDKSAHSLLLAELLGGLWITLKYFFKKNR